MLPYLLAFIASYVFIFLKSWQQLNVVHKQYLWIVPTSMSMAVCEVYVIATTAHNGWGWFILPIGLGGGLGSLCSTYIHSKMTTPRKNPAREDLKFPAFDVKLMPNPVRPAPPMPEVKPARKETQELLTSSGNRRVGRRHTDATRIPEMDIS